MTTDTQGHLTGLEELGERALRTRQGILDASRQLFLERGYAGTRINNITDACGISRAGFYTYFKDKREVVTVLGQKAYEDVLELVGRWEAISYPASVEEIADWIRHYFAFMDVHGAFYFAIGQAAPDDEEFRRGGRRMLMRAAFLLGVSMRLRQADPTQAPEALGLTTLAMLDRTWHFARVQKLPVDEDDMVASAASFIIGVLGHHQA